MLATIMLDSMHVNVAFQSALSIDIVAQQLELWSGAKFCIMCDRICIELEVNAISVCKSVNCYSPKSFPFFYPSLELPLIRIKITCCKDNLRLQLSSTHENSSLDCLFAGYVYY